jgi:DNA-binding CsgD family transcriptional regulator
MPGSVEFALLEGLAGTDLDCLDDCLSSGMLLAGGGRVGYRHELARQAIEEAIPPGRRVLLHREALRALASLAGGPVDPARLAHHAEQANDADAVIELAPVAGQHAAAVGAHREAAGQYGRALRFADSVPARHRARLYERYYYECYLCDQPELALEACRQALAIYRALDDRRAEGEALCWQARLQFFATGDAEAERAGRAAVELLESLPPGRELAMAYSVISYLRMLDGRLADAIEWGERAVTLASRLGETEVLVFALNSVGAAEASSGLDPQREKLQRSLELSLAAGLNEHAVRAYANLACTAVEQRQYQLADANLADGLAFGDEQGIDAWRWYLLAFQARSALERGRWPEAEQTARTVLAAARPDSCDQLMALVILAQVRAGRGEPGYRPLLDQARQIAGKNRTLPLCGLVAVARAEAAWLEGAWAEVGPGTREWLELAIRLGDRWVAGELAFWRDLAQVARAGKGDGELAGTDVAGVVAEPFRLYLTGDWAGAVRFWREAGCPYEAALSLASSGQEADLRRALDLLAGLGARAAAAIVARQLRALGARGLPRGPRAATTLNPGGLTCRELEVLVLLIEGAPNAEIAARLVLAPKTVEHHVSAILRKFGVGSRREVPAAAARHGLASTR